MWVRGPTSFFFLVGIQMSQHHLLKRLFFPPLNGLGILVKNQLAICAWVYSWTLLYPIALFIYSYASAHCCDDCSFGNKFWSWEVWLFQFYSFFFNIALALCVLWKFHMNSRIVKKAIGILIRGCIASVDCFG